MRTGKNGGALTLWKRILGWFGKYPAPLWEQENFPDYFTCPYCSEPEVEAWNCEKVRCHNCGRAFTCDQAREARNKSP